MTQALTQRTVADSLSEEVFAPNSRVLGLIRQAMPQAIIPPESIARGAITAIRNSEALQKCSMYSLISAIVEAAQSGLSLDVNLGQAYLVPFGGTAKLMYGYRGMCELARRSGEIDALVGELRYAKDEFHIHLGSLRSLAHSPYTGPISKRGEIVGAYATAHFWKTGTTDFEYMDIEQIEAIRDGVLKRAHGRSSPWTTNFDEMARKTPIRRLAKRLPQSPALIPLVTAAIRDEYREAKMNGPDVLRETPELEPVREALAETGIVEEAEAPRESQVKEKPKAQQTGKVSAEAMAEITRMRMDLNLKSADLEKIMKAAGHDGPLSKLPARLVDEVCKRMKESTGGLFNNS